MSSEKDYQFSSSSKFIAKGVLAVYKPSLDVCKSHLNELKSQQVSILEQLNEENNKIENMTHSRLPQDLFITLNAYQKKLINIKKEMKCLYERSSKLKKQVLNLEKHSRDRINI